MSAAHPFRLTMGRAAPGPKRAEKPVADSYTTPQNHFTGGFYHGKV